MHQDAQPLRSGLPDGYYAFWKIDVTAGPVYTLDQSRLAPGYGATKGGTGIINLTFPGGSQFSKVRSANANVDSKVVTTAQFNANVVNIDLAAGTAQVVMLNGAGALADPATAGQVIYADLCFETL